MPSFPDARPPSLRGRLSFRRGLASLTHLLASVAFAIGSLAAATSAHARTFDVPCDPLALADAKIAAGSNGEEDVIWLAPGCKYTLIDSWIQDPDLGFPVTIHGRGATLSGNDVRRTVIVPPGAVLYLSDLKLSDGFTAADGGAVHNSGTLTLTKCTVSDSRGEDGGGLYNAENASLTLIASTVSGNVADDQGGGVMNEKGRLTVIGSTFSGNNALDPTSKGGGGGIFNGGPGSRATVVNSTISGNFSRFGAGIFNWSAVLAVSQSTISHNVVVDGGNGGAIYHSNYLGGGKLTLGNSILANSAFPDGPGYNCTRDPYSPSNVVTPVGGNLVEDGTCDVVGALTGDPGLGALVGSPAYHATLPGSAAIDRAYNGTCPGTDQRGALRPRDGDANGSLICDLGAYEAQ
jgi:hypothetical protein